MKRMIKREIKKEIWYNDRGSVAAFLLMVIVIVILVLLFLGYLVYLDYPSNPQALEVSIGNQTTGLPNSSLQFFPNMKFNHNDLSYFIEGGCNQEKTERMIEAFNDLSNRVPLIQFHQASSNPDITVSCSVGEVNVDSDKHYFVAGEGGAKEVIQTKKYNIVTEGVILLYDGQTKLTKCNWSNVELHELLHVFGFDHNNNKNSLMYPYLTFCDQKVDDSIIDELNRLYSEKDLPDLYFENVSVVKKGRYLDFNISVKNEGLIKANDVKFSVLDDGELVETRDLDNIDFGAGILVKIQNFKMIHKDPTDIKFVIDYDNNIEELDETNNVADIKLDSNN